MWPFPAKSQRTTSFYHVLLRPTADAAPSARQGWRDLLRDVVSQPERDRIAGYMGLRFQGTEAHLSTIAVHPDWRGKGLGELLLLTAMEEALQLRSSAVTLEVRASNWVAQRLYRKYGFQFTGTHRGYYRDGEDAWLMAVKIHGNGYVTELAGLRIRLEKRIRRQQPP